MNIPRFSINNKTLVWLFLGVLMIWGIVNYTTISRREDPEIKISIALVITIYPGASADKVERLVTKKLEDSISEMGDLRELRSASSENLSIIFVKVQYDSDVDMAWQRLRNKIEEVRPDLPANVMGPDVMDDFGDVTGMIWALSSDTVEPRILKDIAEDLEADIRKVDSVGKIEVIGEREEAIYIEGSLSDFNGYGFSPLQVSQYLNYQNVNRPAGYVRTDQRNYRLDPTGSFEVLDNVKKAILDVSRQSGAPLRVEDVFDVRRAYKEPPIDKMLVNGINAVALDVRMKDGYNIVEMGEQVKVVAEAFRKRLPPGVQLSLLHDQPRHVEDFINEFMVNLLEGLMIVAVVLFLFMGRRSAFIVALSLPASIILTFAFMPLFSVDMESVSIAAFIIALGMLVDNAIIVMDNIQAYMEQGMDRVEASVKGVQDLIIPVLTGTMGTVVAFLPLLLLEDEMGAYIRSLPIVVSASLLASLILAVTTSPILASFLMKVDPENQGAKETGPMLQRYERFMRKGIRLRALVIAGAVLTWIGSLVVLVLVVGMSFFPEAERDQFTIDVWLPEGSSLANTETVCRQVEEVLKQEEQVVSYVNYLGKGGPRFFITIEPQFNHSYYGQFMVNTKDKTKTQALVETLNERFRKEVPGARIYVKNLLMGVPVTAPIMLRITGPDMKVMFGIGDQLQKILRDIPGTLNVRDDTGSQVQTYSVQVDSEAAAMVGITNTEVALTLLAAYDGLPSTVVRTGDDEIPVYIRLKDGERDLTNTLHELAIPSSVTGAKVPLSALATVKPAWEQGVVKHYDNRRALTILSDVHGRLAADIMRETRAKLKDVTLPDGYNIQVAGEEQERKKNFAQLLVVFGLIIALLLIMLVIQFGSMKQALVILFSVPLAFIGAVGGLWLSGNSFGFMAFLGVVSLAGMVIKNAVVWVEFVDQSLANGADLTDAIVQAGQKRLRPILLTAATTIGGLFPLALFGGALWEGMAWAMIIGLTVATVLTLVVIPIIYYAALHRQYDAKKNAQTEKVPANPVVGLLALALGSSVLLWPSSGFAEHPVQDYMREATSEAMMVKDAKLDLSLARSQKLQAGLSFVPTPEFMATSTRLDKEQGLSLDTASLGLPIEIPEMVLVNQNVYQVSGKLTLPLYAGGKRWSLLSASEHGISARRHGLQATKQGVAFGTVAQYVQLLQAEETVKVMRERLASDRELMRVAKAKLDVQLGVAFDANYAETMAKNSERMLTMAESDVAQKRNSFNDFVGRPLAESVRMKALGPDYDYEPDFSALLFGLRQRGELKGLVDAARASEELVQVAWGDLLPTVALVGEAGYKDGDLGYTEGDNYWMVTAAFQWNLMADALSWGKLKEARVTKDKARLQADRQRKQMELKLVQALRQFNDTRKILGVAKRAVQTAKQGVSNAQAAYETGVLPIATYVEAKKALTDAKANYLAAFYGQLLTEIQLRYEGGQELLVPANLTHQGPWAEDPSLRPVQVEAVVSPMQKVTPVPTNHEQGEED